MNTLRCDNSLFDMTSTKCTAFLFININSTHCHMMQRWFDYFQLASSSFCNSYTNAYENSTFRQLSKEFRSLHCIVQIAYITPICMHLVFAYSAAYQFLNFISDIMHEVYRGVFYLKKSRPGMKINYTNTGRI